MPAVISYLNGVKMPHIVEFRVMVTRVLSTIATVVAGLAGGKVFNPRIFLKFKLVKWSVIE